MTDVTQLLSAAHNGDRQAAAELLPLVYDELRRLAAGHLAREKPGHAKSPGRALGSAGDAQVFVFPSQTDKGGGGGELGHGDDDG